MDVIKVAIKKENIKISSTIDRKLNDELMKIAKEKETSASKIIGELIIEYLKKNGEL